MTDLIERLRNYASMPYSGPIHSTCGEAADRIEQLEALLRHARCPNKDCIDGAIAIQVQANNRDGWDYGLEHCQWCDERKALLAEDRE